MPNTPQGLIGYTDGRVGARDGSTRPARFEVLLEADTFHFREHLDPEQRQADLIAGKPWVTFSKTMDELTTELVNGQVQFGASRDFAAELEPDQLMTLLNAQPQLSDPRDPRRSIADGVRAAQGLANVQRFFDAGAFPKAGSLDSPAAPAPQLALTESELSERFEALLDRMTYQENVVQAEFHGLADEEALVLQLNRSRRDAMADLREDTVDLGAVVDELQTASTTFDERFADLGYAMPNVVPSRKDRYDLALAALVEQEAALATQIDQWNPHNEALKPKIEAYSKMVVDVHGFVLTALDKAGGDRERVAALFEETSEKFEPHLVKAGARKIAVPAFAAPVATPVYEPQFKSPELEGSEPAL